MGVKIKSVTGREIYEAIEADGFGALRGSWFEKSQDGTVRACLLGTAALNLGVQPHESGGLLDQLNLHVIKPDNPWYRGESDFLGWRMIDLFDKKHPIEEEISRQLNVFYWASSNERNRRREELISERGFDKAYFRDKSGVFYELPTWNDALKMAKDILTQVWDETFQIYEYDFEVDFNNYIMRDESDDTPYEPDEDYYKDPY